MKNVACFNPQFSLVNAEQTSQNPYQKMLAITNHHGTVLGYSPVFPVGKAGSNKLGDINNSVSPATSSSYINADGEEVSFNFTALA